MDYSRSVLPKGESLVRHSRMFLAGIQASSVWTLGLKHSGVTNWGKVSASLLLPQLAVTDSHSIFMEDAEET